MFTSCLIAVSAVLLYNKFLNRATLSQQSTFL